MCVKEFLEVGQHLISKECVIVCNFFNENIAEREDNKIATLFQAHSQLTLNLIVVIMTPVGLGSRASSTS